MRAYRPHPSTRQLRADIEALDGVARADIMAPHRGVHPEPAKIVVRLAPSNSSPEGAKTVFSLAEARKWLASEQQQPILVPPREPDKIERLLPVEQRADIQFIILSLARAALDGAKIAPGHEALYEDVGMAIARGRSRLAFEAEQVGQPDPYGDPDGPLARAYALLGR